MGVSGERVPPTLKSVGLTRDRIYEIEWWGDGIKWNCNNRVKLNLRLKLGLFKVTSMMIKIAFVSSCSNNKSIKIVKQNFQQLIFINLSEQ